MKHRRGWFDTIGKHQTKPPSDRSGSSVLSCDLWVRVLPGVPRVRNSTGRVTPFKRKDAGSKPAVPTNTLVTQRAEPRLLSDGTGVRVLAGVPNKEGEPVRVLGLPAKQIVQFAAFVSITTLSAKFWIVAQGATRPPKPRRWAQYLHDLPILRVRLVVGRRSLNPQTEVRCLHPQPGASDGNRLYLSGSEPDVSRFDSEGAHQ